MSKKFFSLISEKDVKLSAGEKIIPKKDFSSLLSASSILSNVKKEALEYKKEVTKECETIKDEAFKKGFQEGLEKLASQSLRLDREIKTFKEEMQKKILPIALQAAKKILGTELSLSKEKIVDIVIQALKPISKHQTFKIYANPQDIEVLEKNKNKIKKNLEHATIFSIQKRDDIEKGGCIIQTEAGIINAELENLWKAFEIAFEKFTKKR